MHLEMSLTLHWLEYVLKGILKTTFLEICIPKKCLLFKQKCQIDNLLWAMSYAMVWMQVGVTHGSYLFLN